MPQKPKVRRVATGIRRRRGRVYEVYTRVNGRYYSKTFPLATPIAEMRAWQMRIRLECGKDRAARGTLAGDVAEYLERVRTMPTFKERERHLELWIEALGGHRPRATIPASDIDRVLQSWLLAGLAASTVSNRRTALMHLWNRLDGKDGRNPVRGTPRPAEPRPLPRALSYDTIQRIFAVMRPSATRARLRVLAYTGLPPALIRQIVPEDIDWKAQCLRTRPRGKGRGADAIVVPLLTEAIDAFREFDRCDAYGPYSGGSFYKAFQHACRKVGVTDARPYDLRHSYGTLIYRVTGDLGTTAGLLLHSEVSTARRYALGAVQAVATAAVQKAHRELAGESPKMLAKKVGHQS